MTEQILNQYFANQLAPDEARRVLDWFDTDAGHTYLTARLASQLGQTDWHAPPNMPAPNAERMLNAIRQRMDFQTQTAPLIINRHANWWAPMRRAAVFIGALLIAVSAYFGYRYLNPPDLVRQTAFGKIQTLRLPDGSTVTLNGNSRLRYAPRWASRQTREVWLDGEGYFQVTHQRNHERFVVHLPNKLAIEVLGTQFNVMARESRAKVVLNKGKIRLDVGSEAKEKLIMSPGDLIYADVKTKEYYRKRVDAAAQSAWQTGRLKFDGTTLQEVATMLEETYGVTVVISDPDLQKQTISGSIPNQSMQTILNGLSTLFDLKVTKQANQIIIQRHN